jgi:hypothetical protein
VAGRQFNRRQQKAKQCLGWMHNFQLQILTSTKQLKQQRLPADEGKIPHLPKALVVSGSDIETPCYLKSNDKTA